MDIKIWAALIAAAVAVVSAIISIVGQVRLVKFKASLELEREARKKQQEAHQLISRYREPLVHAAYDLQSKLYNILQRGLLQCYYIQGNESEKEYTLHNTVYVIAQYLCWREIIRRELQFLDLGEIKATQELNKLTDSIEDLFLTDRFGHVFRIFRGEQRAIGEKMIVEENGRFSCMGYAAFVECTDKAFKRWFHKLEKDVDCLSSELPTHAERLISLQNALVGLINYLDPDCIRFQKQYRERVGASVSL